MQTPLVSIPRCPFTSRVAPASSCPESFLIRRTVAEHRDVPFRRGLGLGLESGLPCVTAAKRFDVALRPMFASCLPSTTDVRGTTVGHLVDGAAGHVRYVVSGVHEPGVPTGVPIRYCVGSVPELRGEDLIKTLAPAYIEFPAFVIAHFHPMVAVACGARRSDRCRCTRRSRPRGILLGSEGCGRAAVSS